MNLKPNYERQLCLECLDIVVFLSLQIPYSHQIFPHHLLGVHIGRTVIPMIFFKRR